MIDSRIRVTVFFFNSWSWFSADFPIPQIQSTLVSSSSSKKSACIRYISFILVYNTNYTILERKV